MKNETSDSMLTTNVQKFENINSVKFDSYEKARSVAERVFTELTHSAPVNNCLDHDDYKVRVRKKKDGSGNNFFSVVSYKRIGYDEKSEAEPLGDSSATFLDGPLSHVPRKKKGGKKARKAAAAGNVDS